MYRVSEYSGLNLEQHKYEQQNDKLQDGTHLLSHLYHNKDFTPNFRKGLNLFKKKFTKKKKRLFDISVIIIHINKDNNLS